MSEPQWQKQGATLSHKNVCKEFGLTEDEVIAAMKTDKLQYLINYAHGNPYYKLLRSEIEQLALELRGAKGIEDQEIKYKLQQINKEINSHKRKLSSLERQKIELIKIQAILLIATNTIVSSNKSFIDSSIGKIW